MLAVCISITVVTTLSQLCPLVMTLEYLMHAAAHHFPFVFPTLTVKQNILLLQTTNKDLCFCISLIVLLQKGDNHNSSE